jgi:hypothetical protein
MPTDRKLSADINICINILKLAKKKRSNIFLRGATGYILQMCPADIKKMIQEETEGGG